jgi:transposase
MTNSILRRRERPKRQDLIAHPHDTRQPLRAYALLWLDDGASVPEVAQRLAVTRQTVYNWASRFQLRTDLQIALRLADPPRCGRPGTATGIIDPLMEAVIERDPREFDYRSTVWTASLLVRYLRDEHQLGVSDDSVRLAIARLRVRGKRPRHP